MVEVSGKREDKEKIEPLMIHWGVHFSDNREKVVDDISRTWMR